ncbi:MAG: hypothetical protein GWM88_08505 [Pseudomonadales bacterium]|nr:hypothetical protein [Pseudomonadales bacterium]NIX08045.1 hypothetical protein [Pseudomonadales bacterium]
MEFIGAFSGLERIAIIAAAMLIAYLGFRLFATARTPGLVFMGLACAVLFGALFTTGSHVEKLGASYQVAAVSPAADATGAGIPAEPAIEVPAEPAEAAAEAPAVQAPEAAATPVPSEPMPEPAEAPVLEEAVAVAPEPAPETDEEVDQPAPTILSSEELGGRIMSVRSENVTLEWSQN